MENPSSPRTLVSYKLCNLCNQEASTSACVCDGEIKLIGNRCLTNHLKESTKVHDLVDLELALKMLSDFNLFNTYLTETMEVSRILNYLKLHSSKLKRSRNQLEDEKSRLFAKIEEVFKEVDYELDIIDKEINFKIRLISDYKRNLCEDGKALMQVIREEGLERLVTDSTGNFNVPVELISEYVRNSISIEHYEFTKINLEEEQLKRLKNLAEINARFESEIDEKHKRLDELCAEVVNKDTIIKEYQENNQKLQNQTYKLQSDIEKAVKTIAKHKRIIYEKANTELNLKKEIKRIGKILKVRESDSLGEFKDFKTRAETQIRELVTKQNLISNTNIKLQSDLEYALDRLSENESKSNVLADLLIPRSPVDRDEHYRTFSGRRYIYYPNNFSKDLVKYDIRNAKASIVSLEDMKRTFNSTSTCELPNGDVLIAGFDNPVSNHVYLYMASINESVRLPDLITPGYFISLYYYRDFVYAFGGVESNHAERYNISTKIWENLKKMKYFRSSLSCVGIGEKIYLFKGKEREIEVFNTITLKFETFILNNSENVSCVGVAYRMDDLVYLITHTLVQVYDTQLNKLNQVSNTFKHKHYTINNIIAYQNNIYFYNHHTSMIQKISASLSDFKYKPHAQDHYRRKLNRYLYKTRDNSKLLHRVDLKHQTTEIICLAYTIDRNFDLTSVCLVDSGEVFIAGFDAPVSGECYLYDPTTGITNRMPGLNVPRYYTSLIYYKDYVYAFGGMDSTRKSIRDAEKLNLNRRISWIELPEMINTRSTASCIAVDNKIYLFGGEVETVEVYDIARDTYELSQILLNGDLVISAYVDERIYIIGEWYYIALSKNLEVIANSEDRWDNDGCTYTQGNVLSYEDSIYFFNGGNAILEKINLRTFERDVLIIDHKIAY